VTENEKQQQLADIAERAEVAEQNGLRNTAKSWRELYANVLARPAAEMILARSRVPKPPNPI